ncbi:MAG: hypothetical protein Q9227_002262 [Pyrenula ochraceoflavens]
MAVTVKHLNADSSFLLTFEPEKHDSGPGENLSPYTVLLDPWLAGDSVIAAPWFARTKHTVPACISHLSEIEEPDLVIVSQNKSDHCHEETLRQLRPGSRTTIAAEPSAARVIRSWNIFNPTKVISLPKYKHHDRFSLLRFYIPPAFKDGLPGEVTVAFIPAKNYMTGLHNAIGITYRPPSSMRAESQTDSRKVARKRSFYQVPLRPASSLPPNMPPVPPLPTSPTPPSATIEAETPGAANISGYKPRISRVFQAKSIELMYPASKEYLQSPPPSASGSADTSSFTSGISAPTLVQSSLLPTPPCSPVNTEFRSGRSFHDESASEATAVAPLPKPISVLYTPHGINFKPDLQPYIRHHLVEIGALPLSVLFHSFDHAQNPWYLGGNVLTGVNGGAEIACGLMAKTWISAHDEEKTDEGLVVKRLVTTRSGVQEAENALHLREEGHAMRSRDWKCDVRCLGVGAEITVGNG